MWLNKALSRKVREKCVFWLFCKIGLYSAISFKTSRRERSIDVAEHSSILKSKGVMRILVIFQDRSVQPYLSKRLGESFPLMWLNIALS